MYLGLEGADTGSTGRLGLDYSEYKTLVLELRGEQGGETLQVSVKDTEYPDYLAPVGPTITLEKDWRAYEIPMTAFAPNDSRRLHVALALNFVPATAPASFAIRNAFYR